MSASALPEGYRPVTCIDLGQDRRTALFINIISVIIAMLLVMLQLSRRPITFAFGEEGGLLSPIATLLEIAVYLMGHELVHGILMKWLGGQKPQYRFTGIAAQVSSDAYFNRGEYLAITLAPVVVWGVVLLGLGMLLPERWFWAVYVVQVVNLAIAAGDVYTTAVLLRQPGDALVQDTDGVMTVYSR